MALHASRSMVDACAAAGIKPFYGPFGDFSDAAACETQFRNAFLKGCLGAWSLHPSQIAIAKTVFSPDPAEVAFAKKIVAAMPDGAGAVMIDGKPQDVATGNRPRRSSTSPSRWRKRIGRWAARLRAQPTPYRRNDVMPTMNKIQIAKYRSAMWSDIAYYPFRCVIFDIDP